jgi:hypothetical protein
MQCFNVFARAMVQGIISRHAPATLSDLTAKYDEVTGMWRVRHTLDVLAHAQMLHAARRTEPIIIYTSTPRIDTGRRFSDMQAGKSMRAFLADNEREGFSVDGDRPVYATGACPRTRLHFQFVPACTVPCSS